MNEPGPTSEHGFESGEPGLPITNCHTHIFTGHHVPPYIGKTFLPPGLYHLLSIPAVLRIGKLVSRNSIAVLFSKVPLLIRLHKIWYLIKIWTKRLWLVSTFLFLVGVIISIHVFFFVLQLSDRLFGTETLSEGAIHDFYQAVGKCDPFIDSASVLLNVSLLIILWLFFPSGRNALMMIFKQLFKILKLLPNKQTLDYAKRYWNIGRFAFYENQSKIFQRLSGQYPAKSRFVILPMDMEYMDAGKPRHLFNDQMQELIELKRAHPDTVFPFVFIDPRRMEDKLFFDFHLLAQTDGSEKVILKDCLIRQYIEEEHFSGFKIYPALGYYPFDDRLLILWLYAQQHSLPITTHCIRGTIFYRGKKKRDWDFHPLFQQWVSKETYEPLLLDQVKNAAFTTNFTHPLNYLCLLRESFLTTLVAHSKNPNVRKAFGYNEGKLTTNLSELKICLGHFGGDDEWLRYFESDRLDQSARIARDPEVGINFSEQHIENNPGFLEDVWRDADWYSICASLMIQFENVYADISYIINNTAIFPLLKETLSRDKLRHKVLFGTDFYVVRNHKSEKNMLAELRAALTDQEFYILACQNPDVFLSFSARSIIPKPQNPSI